MTFERITNLCLLSADTYIGLVGLSLRLPSAFTSESSSNILPSKTSLKQSFPTTLANCKLQTKAFNYRIWKSIKIKFKIHLNHPSKQLFCVTRWCSFLNENKTFWRVVFGQKFAKFRWYIDQKVHLFLMIYTVSISFVLQQFLLEAVRFRVHQWLNSEFWRCGHLIVCECHNTLGKSVYRS